MSLGSRASAYLSTLPMSVPSRLALWLGLVLMVLGYTKNQAAFTLAGAALLVVGIALWLLFRPKGGGVRGLMGLGASQNRKNTKPSRLGLLVNRIIPKREDKKKAINDAVARAQQDPLFNAKRKNSSHKRMD